MTDQPKLPGRPLADLLARLPDGRRLALSAHVGPGLLNAHRAAAAVMGEGERGREGLTDLSTAIRELEAVRAIVAAAAEGGEVVE